MLTPMAANTMANSWSSASPSWSCQAHVPQIQCYCVIRQCIGTLTWLLGVQNALVGVCMQGSAQHYGAGSCGKEKGTAGGSNLSAHSAQSSL